MSNRLGRMDNRGAAAVEFALVLPLLAVLVLGTVEVTFEIWSAQKAEKLSVTLADVVAQSQTVTISDLQKLVSASDNIMDPFPFGDDGLVIISSVYRQVGDPTAKVNWQFKSTGNLTAVSKIGEVNGDADLPQELTPNEKDNLIVAEVFYEYNSLFSGFMPDGTVIYRRAFFKPRLGALTTPPT